MKAMGRLFTGLGLLLTAGCVALAALAYPRLPQQIPRHWNFAGEIDRWADKSGMWGLVAIGAVLFFLWWGLAAVCAYAAKNDVKEGFDAAKAQRNARRIYTVLMGCALVLAAVFFYITWQMARAAALGAWLGPVSLLLMAAVTVGLLWRERRHAV